jgi:membrane associated rhomboid family serine protease
MAANLIVWILYELPDLDGAIAQASFYPCDVENTCRAPQPWAISWLTAMFMHASWDHLLGNLLFLAIFGKNVESAFGRLHYVYVVRLDRRAGAARHATDPPTVHGATVGALAALSACAKSPSTSLQPPGRSSWALRSAASERLRGS